jgi:hypothetical protein
MLVGDGEETKTRNFGVGKEMWWLEGSASGTFRWLSKRGTLRTFDTIIQSLGIDFK